MSARKTIGAALLILSLLAPPARADRPRGPEAPPRRTASVAAAYLLTGGAVGAYLVFLLVARRRADRRIAGLERRKREADRNAGGSEK